MLVMEIDGSHGKTLRECERWFGPPMPATAVMHAGPVLAGEVVVDRARHRPPA
jgi:hypothetical protein